MRLGATLRRGVLALGCAGAALSGRATVAAAQWAGEIETAAGWTRAGDGASRPAILLRPDLALHQGPLAWMGRGELAAFPDGARGYALETAVAAGAALGPRYRIAGRAGAEALARDGPGPAAGIVGGARLLRRVVGADLWLGGDLGATRPTRDWRSIATVEAGGRTGTDARHLRLTARLSALGARGPTYRDTVLATTGGSVRYGRIQVKPGEPGFTWIDASVEGGWEADRLRLRVALQARAGSPGIRPEAWTIVGASFRVGERASLEGTVGRVPGAPELATRSVPVATLGLRIEGRERRPVPPPAPVAAPGRAAAVDRVASDRVRLTLRLRATRTVEVAGDFSGWRALPMAPAGPDTWSVVLPLGPGTYRINVRADGSGWTVPPGLPSLPDEFGGAVGLLRVEP